MSELKQAIDAIKKIDLTLNGEPGKPETGFFFRIVDMERSVRKQHKWLVFISIIVAVSLLKTGAIDASWISTVLKSMVLH